MDTSHAILKRAEKSGLISAGDRIVAGISGGIDSVVLLDLLSRLSKELKLKLVIAHMNYGLRGKESDRDERFVRKLAKKYGVPCVIASPRSGRGNLAKTGNLQNSARDLRYGFFLKVAKKNKANKIAVAHNADDQAETLLLHLVRGSGLKGLGGMEPVRELKRGISIIRPLLGVTRDEIIEYVKERGLKFVEDSTNKTRKYSRNIIRHDILPLLKRHNQNIIRHLCKTAAILRDENDALDEMSYQKAVILSEAKNPVRSKVKFNRSRFLKHHIAIQRRILRLAYARLTGGTADLLTDHIDKMLQIISSPAKEGRYTLPRGVKFFRKDDAVILQRP